MSIAGEYGFYNKKLITIPTIKGRAIQANKTPSRDVMWYLQEIKTCQTKHKGMFSHTKLYDYLNVFI